MHFFTATVAAIAMAMIGCAGPSPRVEGSGPPNGTLYLEPQSTGIGSMLALGLYWNADHRDIITLNMQLHGTCNTDSSYLNIRIGDTHRKHARIAGQCQPGTSGLATVASDTISRELLLDMINDNDVELSWSSAITTIGGASKSGFREFAERIAGEESQDQ